METEIFRQKVVSECKDTRFECNSQPLTMCYLLQDVVSECKDTRFECNSQLIVFFNSFDFVVSECKDTRFECNSQLQTIKSTNSLCCFRMQRYKIWM